MKDLALKSEKERFIKTFALFFALLLLIHPALAATKANLELISDKRSYDSVYDPIISKKSPDFKLGKGIVTTTYEISSYPGTGVSRCVGWGRADEQTYIPYFYFKERTTIPESGPVVGQPYKEVNTFELTQSPGDMLFSAWLNAPAVCEAPQSCNRGTQLPAKQKFTIKFQSSEGSAAKKSADPLETSKKWNKKGIGYYNQGRYDEAIEAFEKAIEIDRSYATPWHNMGMAYYKKGNYEEAIRCFNYALDIKPDFAKSWCYMGRAYKKLGIDDWAEEDIAKARALGDKC